MSKIKEVLEKQAKLLERKAQKAALTTAVAASTVFGFGVTSCSQGENLNDEPKTENVTMTPEERAKIAQEEAQALLKEIEEFGIPTVKKDKEGNVTEVLSSIMAEERISGVEFIGRYDYEDMGKKETVIKNSNRKFRDPEYMAIHQDARVEQLGQGVEKHYRAKDYDPTPAYCQETSIEMSVEETKKDDPYKEVDEQGDTLVIPRYTKVARCMRRIGFKYGEKQETLTNIGEEKMIVDVQFLKNHENVNG